MALCDTFWQPGDLPQRPGNPGGHSWSPDLQQGQGGGRSKAHQASEIHRYVIKLQCSQPCICQVLLSKHIVKAKVLPFVFQGKKTPTKKAKKCYLNNKTTD